MFAEIRNRNEMDATNTFLNLHHIYIVPSPQNIVFVQAFSIMFATFSIVLTGGEVNMAVLGCLCREAAGGREYWLMLICFASMLWCVSIGSRGPGISYIRAWITFVVWTEPSCCCCCCFWHDGTVAVDTRPLSGPPLLSSLIICQLLTLTRLRINRCWQTTVTNSQIGQCR